MKKKILILIVGLAFTVHAQNPEFIVEEENVEITIYNDSTLEIWYYLTIKTTKGPQNGIYFGVPNEYVYDYAASQNGQLLQMEKQDTQLKIWFLDEAQTGDVTEVKISFFVQHMIYPDEEGRLGMEFYPAWWDNQEVGLLRVKFILPEGCDISEVENYPATAENRGMEAGKAFVYFERKNLESGYKFECGVSFPEQYITGDLEGPPITEKPGKPGFPWSTIVCCFAFILLVIIGIIGVWRKQRRSKRPTSVSGKTVCPVCNNKIEKDWASCPHCGTQLTDDTRIY